MPRYEWLAQEIRQQIRAGKWRPGEQLPGDRHLIHEYQVSQTTVTNAMRLLAHEGLVIQKRGRGTFLVDPEERPAQVGSHRVFVLFHNPPNENRTAWFIPQSVLRGAMNNNHHYVIRSPAITHLEQEIKSSPVPPAFICMSRSFEEARHIIGDSLCIVIHTNSRYAAPLNAVNFDKVTSASGALNYLVETLGHRRSAIIWGGGPYHEEYLKAYELTLCRHGIPYDESLVVDSHLGIEPEGYKAMAELLDRKAKFSAVFVDTDLKAIGAIQCLRDRGLHVPEDISVVGSDDVEGISAEQGLTTLPVPFYEMGRRAMDLLDKRIIGAGVDVPSEIVRSEVIERDTAAPFGGKA